MNKMRMVQNYTFIMNSSNCFQSLLLLQLLSCFNRVQLCVSPETAAHQAPPSLGFSSKNTGVGCLFLLQCMKVKRESEVAQSCPTLSDPMDCSPPGSSILGIFQAGVLEWGAIAFSVSKFSFSQSHYIRSDQISRSVVSDSLRPHELQHSRPPCPSPTLGVHSDSCPSSQ